MSSTEAANTELSATLALDMIGRAYLALALLYETTHPGEFGDVQQKIRAYVEDNFRIILEANRNGSLTSGTVEGASHLVNSILTETEHKVATMIRPSQHLRGGTAA